MRIAQVLAGISLAEADVLRKAVGKKDAELIKKELGKFVEKAVARGYDRRRSSRSSRARSRRSAATASTSRTRSRTRSSRTRPRGSRRTIPPSSWRRCCRRRNRRHRQGGEVHQRGARARHRGAAAGRERVGLQVHRGRRPADPLRARRDPQRGRGRDRLDPRRRAQDAPFTTLLDFVRADRPPALQQARVRGADRRRARSTASAATARS